MIPRPTGRLVVTNLDDAALRQNFICIQDWMDKVEMFWPVRQGCQVKSKSALLTGVSGASVTESGFIPAGAMWLGSTSRVVTALGTTNGTTGYQFGLPGTLNAFGDITGTAVGTQSDERDGLALDAQRFSTSAQDVVVTAKGGNFDGTGDILIVVHYMQIRNFKP